MSLGVGKVDVGVSLPGSRTWFLGVGKVDVGVFLPGSRTWFLGVGRVDVSISLTRLLFFSLVRIHEEQRTRTYHDINFNYSQRGRQSRIDCRCSFSVGFWSFK